MIKTSRRARITTRCIAVIIGGYFLCGCANRLFYYPDSKEYHSNQFYLKNKQDVWFNSADGTKLHGWFIPAKKTPAKATIIHYHGNAQNLTSHISFSSWLTNQGYNVFIFDYRGYGKSEGEAEKHGIHQDSVAALRYVLFRDDVDANKLIVLGQSLGGNNALAAINEVRPKDLKAVILDSTFYSYREIVKDKIGNIALLSYIRTPLSWWVVNNDYSAADSIHSIAPTPLLLLHDKRDNVIPFTHSEKLFEIAKDPKKLILVEYGHHTSAFSYKESQRDILQWLDQYND